MHNRLAKSGSITDNQSLWLLPVIIVLLIATFLRTHDLQTFPPAISNDEAINVIDAFHISQTGKFPLYEEDEGRAEPLYRVLLALGVSLWGPSVEGQRIISAFLGVLTVAAVYRLTSEALRDLPYKARWLGALTAAVALTVMTGHLTLSRTLFRTNLELLTVTLSMAFALQSLHTYRLSHGMLAGFFCGLSLYTYTAAWVFPLTCIALAVPMTLFHTKTWKRWFPPLLTAGIVAFIIALPVLYLALTYPRAVFGRAEALVGSPVLSLNTLQNVISQFIVRADENPQYNVALAPLVNRVWLPFFTVGLLMLLVRIRTKSAIFILAGLFIFNLPAVLSNELTHGLRIAKEYLMIAVICGIGVGSVFTIAERLIGSSRLLLMAGVTGLTILLAGNSIAVWQTYSTYWTQPDEWQPWYIHNQTLNHNEWFYRTDRQDFASAITRIDTPFLLPVNELQRQTTRTWLLDDFPDVRTTSNPADLPAPREVIIPYSLESGSLMLDTNHFALLHEDVIWLMPPLAESTHIRLIQGAEQFEANNNLSAFYRQTLPSDFELEFATPAQIGTPLSSFNYDELQLVGWYGKTTLQPATDSPYTLIWSPRTSIGHDYTSFLQILTQDYEVIAGNDQLINRWLYPSTVWEPFDQVPDRHHLDIPDNLPPGAYRLNAGLYVASYPPVMSEGVFADDIITSATIGWLKVPQTIPVTIPADARSVDVTVAENIQLEAIRIVPAAEGGWSVQLYWRSLVERPAFDATIFVHILDANDEIIAQNDRRPWNGQYPTFIWEAGERVVTTHPLPDVELENKKLRLGMYTLPEVQNLSVQQGARDDIFALFDNATQFINER